MACTFEEATQRLKQGDTTNGAQSTKDSETTKSTFAVGSDQEKAQLTKKYFN